MLFFILLLAFAPYLLVELGSWGGQIFADELKEMKEKPQTNEKQVSMDRENKQQ